MLATYGRSKTLLPRFLDSVISNIGDKARVCFCFCVNRKDIDTKNYIEKRFKNNGILYELFYENLPRTNLSYFWNMMYQQSKFGPETIVSLVGDDMQFETKGWEKEIIDKVNKHHGIGVFYCIDKIMGNYPHAQQFYTRKFVDAQKPYPFMCPLFPMDGIDVVWSTVARWLKCLIPVETAVVFHSRYERRVKPDATRKRINSVHAIAIARSGLRKQYAAKCMRIIQRSRIRNELPK